MTKKRARQAPDKGSLSDAAEEVYTGIPAAQETLQEEVVFVPVSQESTEAVAIPFDEAVQTVAYSIAGVPEPPSKQAGTNRFDEAALAEIPEALELYETNISPVKITEDGRPYLQKRIHWHPDVEADEPNIMFDGEPLTEETGLDEARSLRGWHEESRTYIVQIHPDDPREEMHDLPDDDMASRGANGILPGNHQVAQGVTYTKRPTMTEEEWIQEKYQRDMKILSEHFG